MNRKYRMAVLGMALLGAVSALPAPAHADELIILEVQPVDASMSKAQQQAAADCESAGGWYVTAPAVCDVQRGK